MESKHSLKIWFREVLNYYQDNPKHYWFKRKLYGWGWTPATWQGWLSILVALLLIFANLFRFERGGYPDSAVFSQILLPTFIVLAVLIFVTVLTGESPRWQWGLPSKEDNEKKDGR